MKKLAFLLLISIFIFSCEKPDLGLTEVPEVTPVEFTVAVTNASAFSASDGKISITTTSGIAPFKYKLGTSEYQTSEVFSNLIAGTYSVTVQDSKNTTATKTVNVTQPAEVIVLPLVFTLSSTNVSAWGLSDGTITANVTSGMPPYSYSLSNGATNSTGIFTNLLPGNYTVTVTDNKQQTGNKSVEITQPAKPQPVPIYTIALISSKTEISALNLNFMQNRNAFSISFWYNTPTDQLNKNIPTSTTAWLLSTDHSDNITGESTTWIEINKARMEYMRKTQAITKTSTTDWKGLHHIVILYDGSNMKMYLDNVLINTIPSSIELHFNKLYLGGKYSGSDYDYNGTISKIKFYDKALAPDEVDYLYKN